MMEKRLISLVSTPLLVVVVSYSAPFTERFRLVVVYKIEMMDQSERPLDVPLEKGYFDVDRIPGFCVL